MSPPAVENQSSDVVYGGPVGDSAYQARQAKILASKAPGADKGRALREARVAAAKRGEAWKPEAEFEKELAEKAGPLPMETLPPRENPGAVYGGHVGDAAYQAREAKILAASASKHADKGEALRIARAEAAARGEPWKPNEEFEKELAEKAEPLPMETLPPRENPGAVYGGHVGDAAYHAREAKILAASASKHADKGEALRIMKAEAAAKGEAWNPDLGLNHKAPQPVETLPPKEEPMAMETSEEPKAAEE